MTQRMNFGSGPVVAAGWSNVDREDHGQKYVLDLLVDFPFLSDSFDYIVANHSVQQIAHHDLPRAFAELRRTLKPGGVLRVLVPDIPAAFNAWADGDRAWFPLGDEKPQSIDQCLSRYLTWYGTARVCFTAGYLAERLAAGGFEWSAIIATEGYTHWHDTSITELDDRWAESIVMEARK